MGLGTAGTERHLALMAPRRGVGLVADRAGPGGGAVHGLHHAPHPRVALQPRHLQVTPGVSTATSLC